MLTQPMPILSARAISHITGHNWEGVGVVPDIPVPAADALDAALHHTLSRQPLASA